MSPTRLEWLIRNIYIPKMRVKLNSGFIYAEKSQKCQENRIFDMPERNKQDVILGIESSFDESAACLVNSCGEIKSENVTIRPER
jgi:hypothetical protein